MKSPEDIPEAVRALRKQLGWTQRELGMSVGKVQNTVLRWESRKTSYLRPGPEVLQKLAALSKDPLLRKFFLDEAGLDDIDIFGPIMERMRDNPPTFSGRRGRGEQPHPAPQELPENLALSVEIGISGIRIFAQQAAKGDKAARERLEHIVDYIVERAGIQMSEKAAPKPEPGTALAEVKVRQPPKRRA